MNNFSPGMKAVMLPAKEPNVAKRLRRSGTEDNCPSVPLQGKTETREAKDDSFFTLKKRSSVDMPTIGRVSSLDMIASLILIR